MSSMTKAYERLASNIGSYIYAIIFNNKSLALKEGKLLKVNKYGITIESIIASEGHLSIPFFEAGNRFLLHIYNRINIDLLTGKKAVPFSDKLNSGDYEVLIQSVKPYCQKEIHIVYNTKSGLKVANGNFANMGIKELIVKPGPFYNTELRLSYLNIYHIYGNDDFDLIG